MDILERLLTERTKNTAEKEKLLTTPDTLDNRISDIAAELSPATVKTKGSYLRKIDAVEASIPKDHPMRGFATELHQTVVNALQDPELEDYTPNEIISELTRRKAIPRLPGSYAYKRRADASWFGLGGEDEKVKKPPGYDEWLKQVRTEEDKSLSKESYLPSAEDVLKSGLEGAAWGGAISGIASGGSAAPAGALATGALFAAMEPIAHPLKTMLHKTEWYRSKVDSPELLDRAKVIGAELLPYIGADLGLRKAVPAALRGAANAGKISEQTEEMFSRFPSAKRAIELGRSQRNTRLANEAVDEALKGMDFQGAAGEAMATVAFPGRRKPLIHAGLSDLTETEGVARVRQVFQEAYGELDPFYARAKEATRVDPRRLARFEQEGQEFITHDPAARETLTIKDTEILKSLGYNDSYISSITPKEAASLIAKVSRGTEKVGTKALMPEIPGETPYWTPTSFDINAYKRKQAIRQAQQDENIAKLLSSKTVSAEAFENGFVKKLEAGEDPLTAAQQTAESERLKNIIAAREERVKKYSGNIEGWSYKNEPGNLAKKFEEGQKKTSRQLAATLNDRKTVENMVGPEARDMTPEQINQIIKERNAFSDELAARGDDVLPEHFKPREVDLSAVPRDEELAAKMVEWANITRTKEGKPLASTRMDLTPEEDMLGQAEIQTKAWMAAVGRVAGSSGLKIILPFVGTSVALGSLLGEPKEAEASAITEALGTVPKVVAEMAGSAVRKGVSREAVIKAVDEARLNSVPVDPMNPFKLPRAQEGLKLADTATKELGTLTRTVERTKQLPLGIDRLLSPGTFGNIFYKTGYNPSVELASRMEAWINNSKIARKVKDNILDAIPGFRNTERAARKEVLDVMDPLARKYSGDMGAYDAVMTKLDKQTEILKNLEAYAGKRPENAKKVASGIEKAKASIEQLNAAKAELEPIANKYLKEWEQTVRPLADKYSQVRIALAAEDFSTLDRYPWLRGKLSYEERVAVDRIKEFHNTYAQRIEASGHDVISGPYVHHAWHPAWSQEAAAKRLRELNIIGATDALPYSKFFRRTQFSRQLVPDIGYSMDKYIVDAEKRIQISQFWDKKNRNGWFQHAKSDAVQGNPALRDFWARIHDSFTPAAATTANQWMNRYAAFEAFRLIGFAPSVALKHFFKEVGTFASLGVRETAGTMPESLPAAWRLWAKESADRGMLKRFGIKSVDGNSKVLDDFLRSFVHQNYLQNILTEFDLNGYGAVNKLDEVLQRLNNVGSVPIGMVEAYDRVNTVLAAVSMAGKRGMTAQQAVYSIYDTVLKNNFLAGQMTANWMRDPKVRALFLFQSTPFKIMERRLLQAYKTGKSVEQAYKIIPGKTLGEKVQQLAGIKNFVKEGEQEFKKHMIIDALKSEKDIFGTSYTKQFMKELLISGAIISGAGQMGLDLHPQVGHVPFLRSDTHDPTLALSPSVSAVFNVLGQRSEADKAGEDQDFFVTSFLKNWLGKNHVIPLTIHKALRISEDDIPDRYKGSGLQYFFSVPSKQDKR